MKTIKNHTNPEYVAWMYHAGSECETCIAWYNDYPDGVLPICQIEIKLHAQCFHSE